jgi:hypothetical protein
MRHPAQNETRSTPITIAAITFFITGLLYAVGSIPVTAHILREGTLPVIFGIPFYQGSFFAQQGMGWVIASSIAFILVGIADVVTGMLLWDSRKAGALLAIVTFPVIMIISIGGEAPVPLLVEPFKLLLIWFGRRSLTR